MLRWAVSFVVISFLVGCGGSGGSSSSANSTTHESAQTSLSSALENESTPSVDLVDAEITLNFPLSRSLTMDSKVSFAGNVFGVPSGQNIEVRIANGDGETIAVHQHTGSGEWLAEDVSLDASGSQSSQNFSVEMFVGTDMLDSVQTELAVGSGFVSFGVGDALAVDADSSVAYLGDNFRVIAIDLSTGGRELVLDLEDEIDYEIDQLVWLESAQQLVVKDQLGGLSVYGLAQGSWQSLSLQDFPNSATSIAASTDSEGLIVYQSQLASLIEYDAFLSEVDRAGLSEFEVSSDAILSSAGSDIVLVSNQGLSLIDITSESVRRVSFASETWTDIAAISAGDSPDEFYIRDAGDNTFWRISLDFSGVVIGGNDFNYSSELVDLNGFKFYSLSSFEVGDGMLVSDRNRLSLLSYDTLEVSTISEVSWGSGEEWIAPSGLTLDSADSAGVGAAYAYVSDIARDDILQVDLSTGNRQTFSRDGVAMKAVSGIVQGDASIYGVDWAQKTVLSTDMTTGFTSQLDDVNLSESDLAEPIAIDLDSDQFRVLVLDRGLRAICEIDTLNGSSSVLIDSSSEPSLGVAGDLVFDESNQQVYWTSWIDNSIYRMSLNSLQVDLVSGSSRGSGDSLGRPEAVALSSENGELYVFNGTAKQIHAVDVQTGNRRLVTDSSNIAGVSSMTYDEVRGTLVVLDSSVGALYAVYPDTGDMTLLSM